jgi:hypothetical protein
VDEPSLRVDVAPSERQGLARAEAEVRDRANDVLRVLRRLREHGLQPLRRRRLRLVSRGLLQRKPRSRIGVDQLIVHGCIQRLRERRDDVPDRVLGKPFRVERLNEFVQIAPAQLCERCRPDLRDDVRREVVAVKGDDAL